MNSERPDPPKAGSPEPAPPKGSFRVLVVDDNEIDREITIVELGRAWPFERDMKVDSAADGEEALEKLRKARFTLMVLDWKLPLKGGSEVLRTMRENGVRIPVVVLSGLDREGIPEDIESLGASFLHKDDMNPSTLHDAIADSLRLLGLVQPSSPGQNAA